jgi:hypothetical protein
MFLSTQNEPKIAKRVITHKHQFSPLSEYAYLEGGCRFYLAMAPRVEMLTSHHWSEVTIKLIISSSAFSGSESVVDYAQVGGIIDTESDDNIDKDDSQTIFPLGVE